MQKLKHYIQKLKRNNDAKALLENFFSLSALQVFGMVLPLITLPYVLRVLEFDKYGLIVLATSLVAYFQSVTDYSFTITATRDVALFKTSPKKLNLIYSKVLSVKFIFLVLSLAIINTIVLLYPPFREEQLLFFLTSLSLVGHSLFPVWYYRGIEKMKYITIINLSIRILVTCGIFIFIQEKKDYWIYPLLDSVGLLIAGIVGQIMLVKTYKRKFILLKPTIIYKTISSNFPIFVNQFTPTLYSNTSAFLLGIIGSPSVLGIYGAIKKIMLVQLRLINILSITFFPYLTRNKVFFAKAAKIMLVCSGIAIIIPLLLHRFIFWFLNINDPNAIWILIIMNIGAFFISMYYVFGTNFFIARRADKLVMKNTLIASLIGLFLAYPLISNFGIYGATINVAIAHIIMGGGLYYQYRVRTKNA